MSCADSVDGKRSPLYCLPSQTLSMLTAEALGGAVAGRRLFRPDAETLPLTTKHRERIRDDFGQRVEELGPPRHGAYQESATFSLSSCTSFSETCFGGNSFFGE